MDVDGKQVKIRTYSMGLAEGSDDMRASEVHSRHTRKAREKEGTE